MAVWSIATMFEVFDSKRFDSEFFHPKYIYSEEKVIKTGKVRRLGELGSFLVGPFGSAFHVNNYESKSKFRYIRGKDVKPFILLDDDNVYIPENDYKRLIRYAVKTNDLLISVVGTLGNVAIVHKNIEGIFSCKSTVFRNSIVDPYYLLAYLNCKYGYDCLLRRQRGAIQKGLNKDDLETVPVPIFSSEEKIIGDLIRGALELHEKSKSLYSEAQVLLDEELGLKNLNLVKVKSYETTFSEIVENNRTDAEYYNPHSKEIYKLQCFTKSKPLKEMFYILKGQTPSTYLNEGVPVLKTKNIRVPYIEKSKINDFSIPSSNYISIQEGDLIIASMGVGSLGRISHVFDDSTNAIIDGTLRILRAKEGHEYDIIPTLLFLTSRYGQILIYQGIVGSTGIISLPDYHLKNIKIPILDQHVAKKITSLVYQSHKAKNEGEELIQQATRKMEDLIEGGINDEFI
jgi:type I restriction enzyme S subunit